MFFRFSLLTTLFMTSCGGSPHAKHRNQTEPLVKTIQTCTNQFLNESCFTIDWLTGPRVPNESSFDLKFFKKDQPNEPVQFEYELFIYLWMPSMGHGSSPVNIESLEPGHFKVTNVYFIMGGEWQMIIQLKDPSKIIHESIVTLNL